MDICGLPYCVYSGDAGPDGSDGHGQPLDEDVAGHGLPLLALAFAAGVGTGLAGVAVAGAAGYGAGLAVNALGGEDSGAKPTAPGT